jgi:hypothetical protein
LNKFELKETPKFNVVDISYFINLLKSQGIEQLMIVFSYVVDQINLSTITDLIYLIA